jgi:hypothetical protein
MEVTMTDEERAELEKEANAASGANSAGRPAAPPQNLTETAHVHEEPAATAQAPAATSSYAPPPSAASPGKTAPPTASTSASTDVGKGETASGATTPKTAGSTKPGKLTAEQRKQLDACVGPLS